MRKRFVFAVAVVLVILISFTACRDGAVQTVQTTHPPSPQPSQVTTQPSLVASQPINTPKETPLDRDAFMKIINDLEHQTIKIMAAAGEQKALKRPAPTFEELKPKLLLYMTESQFTKWKEVYIKDPGWLLEPAGLLFARKHWMFKSSFQAARADEGKVILRFKTYGNPEYDHANQVEYTLVQSDDNSWRIDNLIVIRIENAFSLDEVKQIMSDEITGAVYVKEDGLYYYFKAENDKKETQNYVFNKKGGYIDLVP